ncbi:hypothetical protein F9B85_10000 [Heliorestis acidaminivorans]|uniref:Uncharacterized protein n=1 Tax=Heliorestis acidaminivorans TaxID=553427 RepID=A0A6I0EZR4_9FIRM|nr:hypothetical protein [Heliorestis acidaminivorans]KAB2952135.1 hypothetical protein F9B85_10000 [Heliorestis acidaminivorans]
MFKYIKLNGELSEREIGGFSTSEEEKPCSSEKPFEINQLEDLLNQLKEEKEAEMRKNNQEGYFELDKHRKR